MLRITLFSEEVDSCHVVGVEVDHEQFVDFEHVATISCSFAAFSLALSTIGHESHGDGVEIVRRLDCLFHDIFSDGLAIS